MAAELAEEAHLPRWRRQSLNEARKAKPQSTAPAPSMHFRDGASPDAQRAVVRYDLVRMTDVPDEITGNVVGELQSGDEVEIVQRKGVWLLVRTPFGNEGWIHRTTLGHTQPGAGGPEQANGGSDDAPPILDTILATITAQRREQAATAAAPAESATLGPSDPEPPEPTSSSARSDDAPRSRQRRQARSPSPS
jgi:hypothetical protein